MKVGEIRIQTEKSVGTKYKTINQPYSPYVYGFSVKGLSDYIYDAQGNIIGETVTHSAEWIAQREKQNQIFLSIKTAYNELLKRDPTPDEYNVWYPQIETDANKINDLRTHLKNIDLTDALKTYTNSVYQKFNYLLQRNPTIEELNYWCLYLFHNQNNLTEFNNFLTNSDEWRLPKVKAVFNEVFKRNATSSEITSWNEYLKTHNNDIENMKSVLIQGDEYQQIASLIVYTTQVKNLFNSLLQRDPTTDELNYWSLYLYTHNADFTTFNNALTNSDEWRLPKVKAVFIEVLQRNPNADELKSWNEYLKTHSIEEMKSVLIQGDEYKQKHPTTVVEPPTVLPPVEPPIEPPIIEQATGISPIVATIIGSAIAIFTS